MHQELKSGQVSQLSKIVIIGDIRAIMKTVDNHVHPCIAGRQLDSNNAPISLELLLSNLPGAVYHCLNDKQWTMRFVSEGIRALTGYAPAAFTSGSSFSFANIIHPGDREAVAAEVDLAVAAGRPYQLTYRIVTCAGEIKWVWEQGAAIRNDDGAAIALEGFIADITRVKLADELVVEQASFLDQARDAIFVIDMARRVTYWNGGAERLFGWGQAEAVGARLDDLIELDGEALTHAWHSAVADGEWHGEIAHRNKDGDAVDTEARWSLIPASPTLDSSQKILVISTDIGERKKNEAKVLRLAFFDPLTELPNRASLFESLHKALLNSVRNRGIGAVMFCDLDNFKTLNDTKGHAAGDAMLRAVSRRLLQSVRETDVVARLGGDEFVILLAPAYPSYEDAARSAESVAENILRNMGPPVSLAGESHRVSTSIGITLFSGAVDTVDSVMMKADAAMYQAKSAGRNALRFFDPVMQASITAQQELERNLDRALADGAFVLHYQSQLDEAGRTVGAEALIRWQKPDGKLILPAAFIKAAEASGQIQELGTWVLSTACAQLAQWSTSAETAGLSLSVNISAHQFVEPGFLSTVAGIFAATGVDPRRLRMELTESLLFRDTGNAVAIMNKLKASGVAFTLDDFGTGYSSLAYLRHFPLDQLKIDRSFVRDVLSNSNDAAIVGSIIALGSTLGMNVIAEGVETQAQRAFLANAGCSRYQGFLFKHALPNDEFVSFVRMGASSQRRKK